MHITPLWHTEFLIDIVNREGKNVKILVDSWLSDYVVGDLMERSVKVHLDSDKLKMLDAIFISHSHTDHLDPYTLVEIYKCANPVLFLSETLEYLDPLFRKYLPSADIRYLRNKSSISWNWLDITAIALENDDVTNEDDVMMLSVASDTELVFAEIDTIPSDTKDAASYLYKHFTRKRYQSICYLASRNELEWDIKVLDLPPEAREKFQKSYLHTRKEEIEWQYAKWEYDDYEDIPNIFTIPGLVRGFIWQGLCYPRYISPELAGISIFPLEEIVDREVWLASKYGFGFSQKAFLPGKTYEIIKNGTINVQKYDGIGELDYLYPRQKLATPSLHLYSQWPLRPYTLVEDDISRVLDVLNHRFLPYWSASPLGNIRQALYKNQDRKYRVWFAYVDQAGEIEKRVFEFGFSLFEFHEIPFSPDISLDEEYWLGDIIDYIEGRQDLYSSFWHRLDPTRVYRLWTCLGANWMNHDLVSLKYALHFDRASRGETVEGWVKETLEVLNSNQKIQNPSLACHSRDD